jgi:histidine ammonia-lyase
VGRWIADALASLPEDLSDRPLRHDVEAARALLTRWGSDEHLA